MSGIGTGVRQSRLSLEAQMHVGGIISLSSEFLQYDLSVSTFSPDGRVFQTAYAQKAVDNGG